MESFKEKATKFKASKEAEKQRDLEEMYDDYKKHQEFLKKEFEGRFADELPMLESEGITVSFHRQNKRYAHMGSYVQFTKGNKTLKMDFSNRSSYRYEFNEYGKDYGSMTYGEWNKDMFYAFIYDNLLSVEQGHIVFENPELNRLCDTYEAAKDLVNCNFGINEHASAVIDKIQELRDIAAAAITKNQY